MMEIVDDKNQLTVSRGLKIQTENTPEQRRKAAQLVAIQTESSLEERVELLAMLGLTPEDGGGDQARALGRLF